MESNNNKPFEWTEETIDQFCQVMFPDLSVSWASPHEIRVKKNAFNVALVSCEEIQGMGRKSIVINEHTPAVISITLGILLAILFSVIAYLTVNMHIVLGAVGLCVMMLIGWLLAKYLHGGTAGDFYAELEEQFQAFEENPSPHILAQMKGKGRSKKSPYYVYKF